DGRPDPGTEPPGSRVHLYHLAATGGRPGLTRVGLSRLRGAVRLRRVRHMALMRISACAQAGAMDRVYELQAETLRTLAHPRRLEILHELAAKASKVGSLAHRLGMSQPNVSQHLALMRASGLVLAERRGRESEDRAGCPA